MNLFGGGTERVDTGAADAARAQAQMAQQQAASEERRWQREQERIEQERQKDQAEREADRLKREQEIADKQAEQREQARAANVTGDQVEASDLAGKKTLAGYKKTIEDYEKRKRANQGSNGFQGQGNSLTSQSGYNTAGRSY